MSASADRNLLFGILALQMDFVTRDQLVAAMHAWVLDKDKPLGDILRGQNALDDDTCALLEALVQKHLVVHGNDLQQALAALSSVPPTLKQDLAAISDEAVQQTLTQVGVRFATPEQEPNRTAILPLPPSGSPGRYRILRPHAKGGLGEVFVAEDAELGRHVALKEIQDRYVNDAVSRDRFIREAEITGGLEHPGIVPVYGLGSYADGRPFYAMRFIKGDNLKVAIRLFHGIIAIGAALASKGQTGSPRGTAFGVLPRPGSRDFRSLEFRQLLQRFIDVCNAVAYAHSRGVLHRDLKPGNIMLGKYGETLLIDWGLAKTVGRAGSTAANPDAEATLKPRSGGDVSSATVLGQAMGTPAYMSPEQAAGKLDELGPATDIYSLGATLYELLTGGAPFTELNLDAVQKGQFPPPRAANHAVPRTLEAVCLKAMARTPADRYGTALDLAGEVERWLADQPVSVYREPWHVRHWRQAVKTFGSAWLAPLYFIVLLLIAVSPVAVVSWTFSLGQDRSNEIFGFYVLVIVPLTCLIIAASFPFWWRQTELKRRWRELRQSTVGHSRPSELSPHLLYDFARSQCLSARFAPSLGLLEYERHVPRSFATAVRVKSVQNHHERAIEALGRAIDQGLVAIDRLEQEQDFNELRSDPRFQALVTRIRSTPTK